MHMENQVSQTFFFSSKSGSRGARAVKNAIDRKEEDF